MSDKGKFLSENFPRHN